jgi:CHAT domain-containing protein
MTSDISAETKNLYQSQNIPVFETAIDVSLIKSKQDHHDSLKLKTYEYTELAKASLLQSQIKQTDALAFAGIPDSLLHKEYDLRIDINWREKQRQEMLEKGKEETDTTVLRISSIIFDLKRAQETLFEILEKDYPEYFRLKYDTKTISLEDTQQKLLQKGQTMLEYFVGDSSIFIFVVRPDTFDVVQVKKDFALDSLVRQMQTGLYGYHGLSRDQRTDDLYKKSIIDYTNAAFELYQRIVSPVSHLLTSDLVIIPDGVLGYVPFEALIKSKPEKLNQFGTYPYMINDHTISYNYSATLWNEMKSKKHKKEPSKSLVAFAPFYEGSYTVLDSTINLVFDTLPDGRDTTIFQDIVSRKTYASLPSSGIEAGTASKLYKGDYFVNSDATEQKFYDVAGDYRMVHLSTHGVADARQGDYSYLAFAEQKDSIENEFLYVRDIYNTQLNADLVFLSACETARGELQRGEGIISLARAFAYAGAKSIITTLWQVDDSATKDISIDFYKNLKKGFTKDVALRQAKLRHIKSAKSAQKHPFFWAAMIGIGDMGQVKN